MTEMRFPKPGAGFATGTECLKKLLKGLKEAESLLGTPNLYKLYRLESFNSQRAHIRTCRSAWKFHEGLNT